jgi:hypothetical protein
MTTAHRPGRWLRASAHAGLGVVLAATLNLAGPGGGTATATAAATAAEACAPGGSSSPSAARVGWGTDNGQDPNSISAATGERLQRSLQSRVETLVGSGVLRSSGARAHGGLIFIRTHIHVIERADGTGGVTRAQVRAQIRALNDGYAGRTSASAARTPFRFRVASVDVTRNDAWYDWNLDADGEEDADAVAAKTALHRGGKADLNVYIAGLGDGLLGYANYPNTVPLRLDGLVILNESLPGGSAAPYNQGDTATHEVGHWLDLAHTFENGCTPPGDYVKDTPYQADGDNIFFCGDDPTFGDDTCPQPGKDPVHNFMSYGDDPCLNEFTYGQKRRMIHAWLAYRRGR